MESKVAFNKKRDRLPSSKFIPAFHMTYIPDARVGYQRIFRKGFGWRMVKAHIPQKGPFQHLDWRVNEEVWIVQDNPPNHRATALFKFLKIIFAGHVDTPKKHAKPQSSDEHSD